MGFHERYVVENKGRYLEGRFYFDEWDKGLRARGLAKQQREQYRRRPDYRERMGAFEWELPEETHSDMFVGDVDHDSIVHVLRPTREQLHRQRAYYLANVSMIDEKIGQVLAALQVTGYLDNAIVLFTSDHGDALGDHGHSQKWTVYEVITRVPTVVWAPGRFALGRKVDGLCQQMDVAPALLELAGVPVPPSMEAQSLLAALQGEPWPGRPYVFAEHGKDGILQETEYMSMVRSTEWKLVHFLDEPFGQLFDLRNDSAEVCNRWDDTACTEHKRALLDVLREWRIRSQYHTRDWGEAWR